jgi:CBS domain-containing protein
MQVRHILEIKGREVATIPGATTLLDATRALARRRIGALVVTDAEGGLAGIISERDLVNAIARHGAGVLDDAVSLYMTRSPATCAEGDPVDQIMEMMTTGRFRHVPVLDGDERLCGMISIGDVVKSRIDETVREAAALRDYISATA